MFSCHYSTRLFNVLFKTLEMCCVLLVYIHVLLYLLCKSIRLCNGPLSYKT